MPHACWLQPTGPSRLSLCPGGVVYGQSRCGGFSKHPDSLLCLASSELIEKGPGKGQARSGRWINVRSYSSFSFDSYEREGLVCVRIRTLRKAREPERRGEGDPRSSWVADTCRRQSVAGSPKVGPRQDPGGSAQGACTWPCSEANAEPEALPHQHSAGHLGDTTPICLKKQRGEGTWLQEWTGKTEVCFHSPKTTLSGISPKLPPSEGSLTREKSQACIPFLVPDPSPCSPSWVDTFALGERPFSFTRNFRSTNNLSPYTETNSTGSGLHFKNKPINILENNVGKFLF